MKVVAALILCLLAACGGRGDEFAPEEQTKGLQPLDCQAQPEVCR